MAHFKNDILICFIVTFYNTHFDKLETPRETVQRGNL